MSRIPRGTMRISVRLRILKMTPLNGLIWGVVTPLDLAVIA